MEEEIVVLQATGVTYFSSGDEDVFFGWLSSSLCKKIKWRLRTLYISINLADVDDEGLRERLALFMRYKIPLRQLKVLDKDEFSAWFKDENKIWYKDIFGRVQKCKV